MDTKYFLRVRKNYQHVHKPVDIKSASSNVPCQFLIAHLETTMKRIRKLGFKLKTRHKYYGEKVSLWLLCGV